MKIPVQALPVPLSGVTRSDTLSMGATSSHFTTHYTCMFHFYYEEPPPRKARQEVAGKGDQYYSNATKDGIKTILSKVLYK